MMKNTEKAIAISLLGAGLLTFALSSGEKKKCGAKKMKKKAKRFASQLKDTIGEEHDKITTSLADKAFGYAVENRQLIANIASVAAPFLLKSFVKKKL